MAASVDEREQQDYPLSEVPMSARKGLGSLGVVLLGFTFFTATMFAGGALGPAFPFWPDLITIIAIGNLLLGAYVGILSLIAFRSGLNTALMSRFGFGMAGSHLPDALLGFTQIGWYGWGTATIAVVFLRLIGLDEGAPGYTTWLYGLMVLFGAAFCWTAWVGYRGLELLSLVAVPLMTLLLVVSLWIAVQDAGGFAGLQSIQPSAELGLGTAITIVFGTFISGGTQATNWTRFARTASIAVLGALAAFFIGNGLMVMTGAIGSLVYQQSDVVEVMVVQGLLAVGIVMLFLNIWTTQDNTIYNFSVVGCNSLRTRKRRLVTIVGAAIGTVLALMRIDLYLVSFLLLLGTFIPPIGGIIMADYFYKHRGRYPLLAEAEIPAVNTAGLLAYAFACLVAYVSPGVPPLNGIVAAVIGYILADKLLARRQASVTNPA